MSLPECEAVETCHWTHSLLPTLSPIGSSLLCICFIAQSWGYTTCLLIFVIRLRAVVSCQQRPFDLFFFQCIHWLLQMESEVLASSCNLRSTEEKQCHRNGKNDCGHLTFMFALVGIIFSLDWQVAECWNSYIYNSVYHICLNLVIRCDMLNLFNLSGFICFTIKLQNISKDQMNVVPQQYWQNNATIVPGLM